MTTSLPEDVELYQALPLMVKISNKDARVEIYIDNTTKRIEDVNILTHNTIINSITWYDTS